MSSLPKDWDDKGKADSVGAGTTAIGTITFDPDAEGVWCHRFTVMVTTSTGVSMRWVKLVTGRIASGVVTVLDTSDLLGALLGGLLTGWGVSFAANGDRLLDVRLTVPAGSTASSAAYVAECTSQAS